MGTMRNTPPSASASDRSEKTEVITLLSKLQRAASPSKAKTLRAKLRRLGHHGGITQATLPRSPVLRKEFKRLGIGASHRKGHDAA